MEELLGSEVEEKNLVIHEQPLVETNETKYVLDLDPTQVSGRYYLSIRFTSCLDSS